MPGFRCLPMPSETAARWRATGRDDRGNGLIERRVARTPHGAAFPCRHCLRSGEEGDVMLLGSHNLPRPPGVYWTPSPIFVHASPCPRFDAKNEIAPTVLANSLVSVRSYDGEGLCLYDLGQVCEGMGVAAPLHRALDDPRTAFVNIHTARPGCWLAGAERL